MTRIGTFCEKCRQVKCICHPPDGNPFYTLKKPIKVKPHFYSACFQGLQQIAKDMGYNLLIHGSMNRDMDLVAAPWIDEPKSHYDLLRAFCEYLGVSMLVNSKKGQLLSGGRSSYVINLNRDRHLDAQYYLDISITPLK